MCGNYIDTLKYFDGPVHAQIMTQCGKKMNFTVNCKLISRKIFQVRVKLSFFHTVKNFQMTFIKNFNMTVLIPIGKDLTEKMKRNYWLKICFTEEAKVL